MSTPFLIPDRNITALQTLRDHVRHVANQGMLTPSACTLLEDDLIAAGMPAREARDLLLTEREAAVARAQARIESRASVLPELDTDDDGLARALALAGWSLRWNRRGLVVEARRTGSDGPWTRCDGNMLDMVLNDCSKHAVMRRGMYQEPWRIVSGRQEKRLVVCVAMRRSEDGDTDVLGDAIDAWQQGHQDRRWSWSEVAIQSRVVNKYEAGTRLPRHVEDAIRTTMTAAGWEYKTARRPGRSPARLWCPPAVSPPPRPRRVRLR